MNNKIYFKEIDKQYYNYVLGVDLDGVCWDLVTPWVEALNKKHLMHIKPEDITDWDIAKFFPGLSRNQVFAPLHEEAFFKRLELYPDVEHYWNELEKHNVKLLLVSSSHPQTIGYKMDAVMRLMPFVSIKDIIITSHKPLINIDGLVDDGLHNFEFGDFHRFIYDAPHNRNFDGTEFPNNYYYTRVHNWKELYNCVMDKFTDYTKYNNYKFTI